jgi:UDP-N-acetylmuramate dehydrogenase
MMSILKQLPEVRGSYTSNEPMSRHTWFGVGGPADVIFHPIDENDLVHFLVGCPHEIPLLTVGAGSNLLVRDGGIDGVVIKLSTHMTQITHEGTCIKAQTGATDADVARYAQRAGIGSMEFLIGIPGTIGGGLRMNAGAYGSEFRDIIIRAYGYDRDGNKISATPAEMGMTYRHSDAPSTWIFTSAELQGTKGESTDIKMQMKNIIRSRGDAQPRGVRTGGSTFTNPKSSKAWQEIDKAGCRGLQIGGAQVSEKHCNFLINNGSATARDIETLGETVRQRVLASGGPDLSWEIRRIGKSQSEGPRNDP